MNNFNKALIKLLYILFIVLQSCGIENNNESTNNSSKDIEVLYSNYFKETTKWIEKLSPEKKENRQKFISRLKENPIYIQLVDSVKVSASYLSIISAIASGVTYTMDKEYALMKRLESQELGEAKINFVITSVALSLQTNGGFPKELIEVFERYRNKYKYYGVKGFSFDANQNKEKIEYDYDYSAIFAVIAPTSLEAIEAVYEARDKNISVWNKEEENYTHYHVATLAGYMQYIATNHPSSKYYKTEEEKRAEFEKSCMSVYDGSHRNLTKYIKEKMNDPSSYEHNDTKYKLTETGAIIKTSFRGNNALGVPILHHVEALVSSKDCAILKVDIK